MDARLTGLPQIAWVSLGWFPLAWAQIWQVTLLVLLVWALVRAFGRNRPHLASVLWLVVLIKCVTPPIVSSRAGVFCWLQPGHDREAADSVAMQSFEARLPAGLPAVLPSGGEGAGEASGDVVVRLSPHRAAPLAASMGEPSPRAGASAQEWIAFSLGAVWLAGCVISAGVLGWRWRAMCRRLRAAKSSDAAQLAGEVIRLCDELNIRSRVRLLVTPEAIGPAVVGLWRPLIILPAALVEGRAAAELRPLLAHELVHIRRGDLWLALLQTLAALVWWFHPLVRLASRLLSREAERCCDEAVIAHLGCDPAAYARNLLDVLALKQQLRPVPAFPGVRPLDVTSQRLERIMQLRQGCHKRTPWWCWLAMIALAVVVLPGGALWVEAQEKDGEGAILPAAYQQAGQQPAAPTPAAPWEPKPAANAANDSELSTRVYYVRELLSRLEAEKSLSIAQAKEVLAQLVRSSDSGRWPLEAAKLGENADEATRLPKLAWADDSLVVRHHSRGHDEIARELKALEKRGFAELAVEVRIISGPAALLKSLPADWRFIGGPAPGEDREASNAAASVVERQLPAMLGVLDHDAVRGLLDTAQTNARTNVLQAPKVTLFNGQFARIEDTVQRPFVVGVKPAADGGQEPQIRVVTEGMSIRLRPELQAEDCVSLQFGLILSAIENVDIASFPVGSGKVPISVQVPEVATTRIESAVDMKLDETIAIHVPTTANRAKKDQPLCVLVTVRKVAAPEKKQAIVPPAQRSVHAAADSEVPGENALAADTSPGRSAKLAERVYPVADLVISPPRFALEIGNVSETPSTWQELSSARRAKKMQQVVTADFETLVDLITTTIAPSSWSNVGGECSISISASNFSLLIRQTNDVHEQIADLVEQLRRLQDVQIILSAERIELSQDELKRMAAYRNLSELAGLAAKRESFATISDVSWEVLRKAVQPKVDWQSPRITAFNGQAFDLLLERRDTELQDASRLRIQPVAAADLQAVRLAISKLPDLKDRNSGEPASTVATNVPPDHLLLVDLDAAGGNAEAGDAAGAKSRRLCLIRSKIIVLERDTQSLSPRPAE